MKNIKNFLQYLNESAQLSTKLYDLIKYLQADFDDKISDLPEFFYDHYPQVFEQWISDEFNAYADEDVEEDDQIYPESISELYRYPAAYKAYCEFLYQISNNAVEGHNPYDLSIDLLPAFITISYEDVVEDEWMAHFTGIEAVQEIVRTGYFHGVASIDNLAITASNDDEWTKEGYCFAYRIDDTFYNFDKFGNGVVKYGTNGVMFKASGVKVYHAGDEELQVIFIGNTASELVGFYKDEDDDTFYTLDKEFSSPDFDDFKIMVMDSI